MDPETIDFLKAVRDNAAITDFEESTARTLREMGFDQYAYLVHMPGRRILGVDNFPTEFRTRFLLQDYVFIDPVLTTARRKLTPFEWAYDWERRLGHIRLTPKQKEILDEGADFGITKGTAFPIPSLRGGLGILVANSSESEREVDQLWRHRRHEIHLNAFCIHEAFTASLANHFGDYAYKLAPRETECLQWAASGKTVWETSEILGISEHTVRTYLDRAMRKLDCYSKQQAIVKAIYHGLIDA